jgi:hypothetical protein
MKLSKHQKSAIGTASVFLGLILLSVAGATDTITLSEVAFYVTGLPTLIGFAPGVLALELLCPNGFLTNELSCHIAGTRLTDEALFALMFISAAITYSSVGYFGSKLHSYYLEKLG